MDLLQLLISCSNLVLNVLGKSFDFLYRLHLVVSLSVAMLVDVLKRCALLTPAAFEQ